MAQKIVRCVQQTEKLQGKPFTYPFGKNPFLYATLTLSFLLSFILYLMTLAPTVTFEDSGELMRFQDG